MDGKRTKLSLHLSRKRKRESAILEEDSSSVKPVLEKKSSRKPLSTSSASIEETIHDHVEKEMEKTPESAKSTSTTCSSNHPSIAKNNIVTWLKRPCSPRTTQCPVCDKVVLLAKINQHLDNDCHLDTVDAASSHTVGNFEASKDKTIRTGERLNCLNNQEGGGKGTVAENVHVQDLTYGSSGACDQNDPKGVHVLNHCKPSNSDHSIPSILSPAKNNSVVVSLRGSVESQTSCLSKKSVSVNSAEKVSENQNTTTKSMVEPNEDYNCGLSNNTTENQFVSSIDPSEKQSDSLLNEELVQSTHCTSTENLSDLSNTEDEKEYEPYYISNFKLVLSSVFSHEDDKLLFNEQDNKVINTFNDMLPEEQKLYIRLFQRKRGWFRCSKLEYPKISKDLKPVISCLVEKEFLEDDSHLTSLRETLNLVVAPELKDLVKSLHISQKGGTKEDILEAIISQADNQKTLFGSFRKVVLKRAKQVLGPCVRVAADSRDVFSRILLLFTMNVIPDDEDTTNNGQAQQLSTLYLANIGRLVYPSYLIDRPTPVFFTRDTLMAFSEAYQRKHEMLVAFDSNNFEVAHSYYPAVAKQFEAILADMAGLNTSASLLPGHLRCFTSEWVVTKMCYFGVEVLQKWRRYAEAVDQLELLLQQTVFCFDSRGRWYDRLALNLHQHLKKPEKAMEVIRQGLADPHVRFGRRLALVQRAKRILSSPGFKKGKKNKSEEFADLDLKEPNPPKSITITGTRCAELGVFIAPGIDQDGDVIDGTTTFCAVEEYALSYYRCQGFDQGIHGEGNTFTTLYCLFMWDVIFSSGIPDVFRSPFQAAPLDMCFDSFYISRKEIIDKRLEEIKDAPVEKLQEKLLKTWTDYQGQLCSGLNWERFSNVDQAKQLVGCLGGTVLSGIFTRFAEGYRYHCSGIPDLVVWNSSSLDYRIAEVKGPGDRLSTKQQIWLDVLESLGANVEVCYVTAVGAKRLRKSS